MLNPVNPFAHGTSQTDLTYWDFTFYPTPLIRGEKQERRFPNPPSPPYQGGNLCQGSCFILSICFLLIICQSVIGNDAPSSSLNPDLTRTNLFADLHPGVHIYRYDWDDEQCVLYVAEMNRFHTDLHFEAAIAKDQILGKETVRSIANRRSQREDRRVLVAINGGFGVLGDMKGYGGALENLHIQAGELMTQPASDKEACFGVTSDGDFLIGPVEMEASVTVGTYNFPLECINQRFLDGCQSILYTPRMGNSTHTNRKRAYEIVLTGLKLPIMGSYESKFTVNRFGRGGNNPIPENGTVISFRSRIDKRLETELGSGKRGKIEIKLKPAIWNNAIQAIGGRVRLVKNGRVNEAIEQHHRAQKKHTPGKRQRDLALSYEPRTALGYNEAEIDSDCSRRSTDGIIARVYRFIGSQAC